VLLAPRDPDRDALQGLPVNQTASEAGVVDVANDPAWRLLVVADGRELLSLDRSALEAMPQRSAELPIACVEGWSRSARWRGVSMRDVLERAGVEADRTVVVESLERNGLYGTSVVEPQVWRDRDTLLALELNGSPLDVDHGFPVRLIAPNRPGVMQTKWLARLVVR
jgi:DMSO/TMAO reductase YedYZ molybdopterin-dependent catalytic subunit